MRLASVKTRMAVGGFILAVMLLLSLLVFTSDEGRFFWQERRRFQIVFQDVNGLQIGAPVKMAGLSIGEVTDMDLHLDGEKESVQVTIEVVEPHFENIREGSKASLQTQGVLGDRFVSLTGNAKKAKVLEDGAQLNAASQVSFESVLNESVGVLSNLKAATDQMRVFAANMGDGTELRTLVANLSKTSAATTELMTQMNAPNSSFRYLSGEDARAKIQQSLENFTSSTNSFERIAARIERGEGTLGRLINDPSLHDGAQQMLGQSNRRQLIENVVWRSDESAVGAGSSEAISH